MDYETIRNLEKLADLFSEVSLTLRALMINEIGKTPYGIRVDNLGLSARSRNCLIRAGYRTVQDIVDGWDQIKRVRYLGEKISREIWEKMRELGIDLPWPPPNV